MFAIPVIGRHIKFLVLVRLAILLLLLLLLLKLLLKLLPLKILLCQLKCETIAADRREIEESSEQELR
jgi:hypothetical protein